MTDLEYINKASIFYDNITVYIGHNLNNCQIKRGEIMGYIAWLVLGALAGWIASIIMGKNSEMGAFSNIIVGIVGAFIGGFIFNLIGASGVTGFNIWSIIVSVIGACVLLYIVNKFRGNEITKE